MVSLSEEFERTWVTCLIGIGLLGFGCWLLTWNEGRAVHHAHSLDETYQNAVILNLYDLPLDSQNGKVVHVTGNLLIDEPLTESEYGVAIQAVKLKRRVQMYQWVEERSPRTDDDDTNAGTFNSISDYYYVTEWRDKLVDSTNFYIRHGHENPREIPLKSVTYVAPVVKLGHLELGEEIKEKFDEFVEITSDERPERKDVKLHMGIYYHCDDIWNPEVGDMRVQFYYAGGTGEAVTIIAKQDNDALVPYETTGGHSIALLRQGNLNINQMFSAEHFDARLETWKFRGIGVFILYASSVCLSRILKIMYVNLKYNKYLKAIEDARKNYSPCENIKCSCYSHVISNDLEPFKNGISKQILDDIKSKGTKYQIINNRLYRDEHCMFPARCLGVEHFLLELIQQLPDVEFILNTRDWPQIHKTHRLVAPVFSFSKTADYYDIMYPAWAFWEGGPAISLYPRGIGRWDIHRKQLGFLGNSTNWSDKMSKVFFRGSRTSAERDPLILLSREYPDLVDAAYTKNQAWKSDADTLHAPPAKEVSFEDHCQYKYLFNFRGVAASFRFKHMFLCKSLVFHVGKEWQEFFYSPLKPWIHYIPIEANSSKEKLLEILQFVKNNDDIAKEIAENGYNFIWNNLKLSDVRCYWKKLIKKYAKLLTFKPVLDEKLIEIKGK
ncbi:unnamed protein product [Psylliodes chrysocephalus]|uniref:Glycosyl transferase CAP10 domain-containing protein n=1 Tax=Psylliodes chrysocephalus TaxID=3402493 RepID=A0A9P0CM64_9CUCU|nr:unnamed protein product [Psylliodes chrysocephala]